MKRWRLIVLPLLVFLLQTGCSNRVELNHIAIISATGVDWHDGSWVVTQAVMPQLGSQTAAVDMFFAKGDNFHVAYSKANEEASRKLYLSSNAIVIIGQEAARKGLSPLLEAYLYDYELRETANLYLVKGSARSMMEQLIRQDNASSSAIQRLNIDEGRFPSFRPMTVHRVLADLLGKTRTTSIPGLNAASARNSSGAASMEKPTASAKVRVNELGLIVEDRLVGWLTDKQSEGVMWLSDRVGEMTIAFACSEDGESNKSSAAHIIQTKTKQQAKLKAGKWHIHIDVQAKGDLLEYNCGGERTNPAHMKAAEEMVGLEIKAIMLDGWHAVRRYKADVAGFGHTIHRKYPKQWKAAAKEWVNLFPQTEVIVDVDVSLKPTGMSKSSFKKLQKEAAL